MYLMQKQYKAAFPYSLAAQWGSFVDCPKRLMTEAPFLNSVLRDTHNDIILDACTGIGCESIYLSKLGYKVTSNEIDPGLRTIADANGKAAGVDLSLTSVDWREIDGAFESNAFHKVLLLGNSLGLLNDYGEIESSLARIYTVLKAGGCLVIDQRNYDYILDEREEILRGAFRYSSKYVYCGQAIVGRPVEITDTEVVFGYYASSSSESLMGTLSMLPIRRMRMLELLRSSGFVKIDEYYDFQSTRTSVYDFVTFVAKKAVTG
jgi:SAM-dependent methyltransferase